MNGLTEKRAGARKLEAPQYSFSIEELNGSSKAWGCNCGPGALAAILGLKPEEVRQHIPGFDAKRYTNLRMMEAALGSLDIGFQTSRWRGRDMAKYGLCRVQWCGPWTDPGAHWAAAARKTHWIASMWWQEKLWVFDVNSGWETAEEWEKGIALDLLKCYKGATGWTITHRIELRFAPLGDSAALEKSDG